jgi:hypothetical protein
LVGSACRSVCIFKRRLGAISQLCETNVVGYATVVLWAQSSVSVSQGSDADAIRTHGSNNLAFSSKQILAELSFVLSTSPSHSWTCPSFSRRRRIRYHVVICNHRWCWPCWPSQSFKEVTRPRKVTLGGPAPVHFISSVLCSRDCKSSSTASGCCAVRTGCFDRHIVGRPDGRSGSSCLWKYQHSKLSAF